MRLIVDISALGYAAAWKLRTLSHQGRGTGVIYGVLRSLESLLRGLDPEEVTIAWDSGHVARSAIAPEYKASRRHDPAVAAALAEQMPRLREVLRSFPVINIERTGVEADDIIAAVCGFLKLEEVGIVSGDHDLWQLTGPRCRMFDRNGYRVKLDLSPRHHLIYKLLVGDRSDCLAGVDGIGDVNARRLIKHYDTLRAILKRAKRDGRLGRMEYADVVTRLKRNVKLMRLDGGILRPGERQYIVGQYIDGRRHRRLDLVRLNEWGDRLNIQALRNASGRIPEYASGRIPEYVRTFVRFCTKQPQPSTGAKAIGTANTENPVEHVRRRPTDPQSDLAARGYASGTVRRIRRVTLRDQADPPDESGADQRDPQGAHRGTPRAVLALVERARAVRARRLAEDVLHRKRGAATPQVQPRRGLSLLSILTAEGLAWLRQQSTADLRRVKRILDAVVTDTTEALSDDDVVFIVGLDDEYTFAAPSWMDGDTDPDGLGVQT